MLPHEMIETGEVRYKDGTRIWIARHDGDRDDNLLCVPAVLEKALANKTVMHHFDCGQLTQAVTIQQEAWGNP